MVDDSRNLADLKPNETYMKYPILYRSIQVDGLSIFYRETGPGDAPTILLLHGLPSSSRMFDSLLARLSGRFRLVAPIIPVLATAIGRSQNSSLIPSTASLR